MSQNHPVAIDSDLLSQVSGGTAKRPTPITDALNRAQRTASAVVNQIRSNNIINQCGRPPENGSSERVVGRSAAGDTFDATVKSDYAVCTDAVSGK